MISKTRLRKEMRKSLYCQKSIRKSVFWEMSKFRHALFDVVEHCPRIRNVKFEFDRKNHTTICHLIYQTQVIHCYDNQSGLVRVKSKTAHKFSAYNTLYLVVRELQPKIEIKRRITKGNEK